MLFSYNWLKEYIKGKLPKPEKLSQILTMRAFEVEEVKKVKGDFLLDIDVLPNRAPDCFSYVGMAREISAILNLKFVSPKFKIKESKEKSEDFIKINIKNKEDCFRYTGRIIKNVKVGPSPKEIKERLKILGLNSINNVVDILNYVMLETGQPLHAFDLEKITKREIIVRKAKNGEKIETLDGKKYTLTNKILIIADRKEPLAIAGIKGGKKAEINSKTKNIVIESANFNPLSIRKARQILNLQTDASLRFEHGIDVNLTEKAIDRVVYLIQKYCGGEILKGKVDIIFQKSLPKIVRLNFEKLEKLSGIKIPKNEILKIFKNLEFEILKKDKKGILVKIPTFRKDIQIEEDLIEEVVRIYGLEKIPEKLPLFPVLPPKRNDNIFWENVTKDFLKEMKFTEVYNYSFFGKKEAEIFPLDKIIEVKNPQSEKFKYLRCSLIPNLLKNVKENLKYFEEFKIFELGKIFFKEKNKVLEKRMLSGAILRRGAKKEDIFYEMKGVLDSLFEKLGISQHFYDEYKISPETTPFSLWNLINCAEIRIDNTEVGFLGEINKKILEKFDISENVIVFDIDFEKLQKEAVEEVEYRPVSPFPAVIRDIAILVPKETKVIELLNIINSTGGDLIRDVDLFDLYEGKPLPEGKKNVAFHIIYQAKDRTLTSKEVDKLHQKIIKAIEKNPEWEVRK